MGGALSAPEARSHPPRFPAQWRTLPHDLLNLGDSIFGGRKKLQSVLSSMVPPTLVFFPDYQLSVWLVQHPSDNSLQRIAFDAFEEGDTYGLGRVRSKTNGGLLVDIGANLGDMTIAMAKLSPGMQVLAVEPVPSTYFFLRWNLHLNGVVPLRNASELGPRGRPGVLAMHAATIGGGAAAKAALRQGNATVTMRFQGSGSSQDAGLDAIRSASPRFKQKYAGWQTKTVAALHLPSALGAWESVELLKLDCEMCEYELIAGSPMWFTDRSKVRRVGGELHGTPPNADARTMEAAAAALRQRGCAQPGAGNQRLFC